MSRYQNALTWFSNAFYNALLWIVAIILAMAVVATGAGLLERVIG